jgi:hypothetical protein
VRICVASLICVYRWICVDQAASQVIVCPPFSLHHLTLYSYSNTDPVCSYCTLPLLSLHSVQIWPKDKALVMPAGAGRNEPNSNPFCPPPVGRFKFSWYVCCPVMCATAMWPMVSTALT